MTGRRGRCVEICRDARGLVGGLPRIVVRFPSSEERPTLGREANRVYEGLWRTLRTLSEHEQRIVLLNLCSAHVQATENRVVQGSSQQAWVVWWSDDAGWRYLVEDTRDPDASWGRTGWFKILLGKDADDDALLDAVRVEVPDFVGTIRRGWPAQTP